MKQKIKCFEQSISTLRSYSEVLSRFSTKIYGSSELSESLQNCLAPSALGIEPREVSERLRKLSSQVLTYAEYVEFYLSQDNVIEALISVVRAPFDLGRNAENVLMLQGEPCEILPPPYAYLEKSISALENAFPREIGGPLNTPEIVAFQRYLETVENPWRK